MAFWLIALIYFALTVGYELLRPKQKFDTPKPSGLGDFQFPTIGEGRVIPMVFGTCKLSGPMVTWYGDLVVQAVKKKVKTGLFSSEKVTTGYKYYLTVQLTLCTGAIDSVEELLVDDKPVLHSISPMGEFTRVIVDDPEAFGGKDSEGGIQGNIDVYLGSARQTTCSYLESKVGASLPAYRGICYAVLRGMYLGMSPYIKSISLVVKHCPNSLGLEDGHEEINGDANAAAMIFEALTLDPRFGGLGLPAGLIDIDNFKTIGDTLYQEGMGLSLIIDRGTSARDFILNVLEHIDATMYVEPTTGLLTLKLIRFDYSPSGLPLLDESNCTVKGFSRPSWTKLKNTVRVSYIDRDDGFVEKVCQAQDLASIEIQGGQVSVHEISLPGFSNSTNGQIAASRALAALTLPLATLNIEADRSAWAFRPGTVFKLNWPPLGITGMVCRVPKLGTGSLESGKIGLEAMEDVFAVDWTAYTDPPPSGWSDPITDVPPLTDQAALPAPYEAVQEYGTQGEDVQLAMVMAARGEPGVSTGYKVWVYAGPGWFPATVIPFFTPSGTLESAIDEKTTELSIVMGPDADNVESIGDPDFAQGVNVAWILGSSALEEFIAFRDATIDEGILTLQVLARGCLDTAPTAFPADTRVWFISYGTDAVNVPAPAVYPPNQLRFQPYNNRDEYPFASCTDTVIEAIDPSRADRVYCPTAVLFNGESYPDEITGELTVSWSHRNRLGTWSYSNSGATSTPEDSTIYTVKVYGELGSLVHTEPCTGTSWTYLEADEIAESGLGRLNNHLRVVIETSRDGVKGIRDIEWEFDRV